MFDAPHARARARLDAAEAATLAEFDQRGVFVDDGMVNTRSWLAHHTGVARAVAGGRVLLAKRLRHMPLMANALAEGRVTNGHADRQVTVDCHARPRQMILTRRDSPIALPFGVAGRPTRDRG